MALEEWESPGLIRRQYSKRLTRKRRSPFLSHQVYTVSEETSSTMVGLEGREMTTPEVMGSRLYRKYNELDVKSPVVTTSFIQTGDVQVSIEAEPDGNSHDALPRQLDVSNLPTMGTSLEKSAKIESTDSKPTPASFNKMELEPKLSDSGVDTESILCESLPSGDSSPNVAMFDSREIPLTIYNVRHTNQSHSGLFDGGVKKYTAKASILEPSGMTDAMPKDRVRVHVEVIEIVDSGAVKHTDGSLVSTVRQCQIPSDIRAPSHPDRQSSSPSFVFSLLENRFVLDQRGEEIDTYSCHYDTDLTPHRTVQTCSRDPSKAPIKTGTDQEIHDASSGRKRTSKVLRDSSRYSDDITKLNDLIIQGLEQELHDHTHTLV